MKNFINYSHVKLSQMNETLTRIHFWEWALGLCRVLFPCQANRHLKNDTTIIHFWWEWLTHDGFFHLWLPTSPLTECFLPIFVKPVIKSALFWYIIDSCLQCQVRVLEEHKLDSAFILAYLTLMVSVFPPQTTLSVLPILKLLIQIGNYSHHLNDDIGFTLHIKKTRISFLSPFCFPLSPSPFPLFSLFPFPFIFPFPSLLSPPLPFPSPFLPLSFPLLFFPLSFPEFFNRITTSMHLEQV